MIEEKIKQYVVEHGKKIVILQGVARDQLPRKNKYFNFELGDLDTINIGEIESLAIESIIKNRDFNDSYKWMTMEEYKLVREEIWLSLSKVSFVILKNNLYDKQFPYQGTLSDINNIYQQLYYSDDNELDDLAKEKLEQVSNFYGKIDFSKQSGQYYVTYPKSDIPSVLLYESKQIIVDFNKKYSNPIQRIELSDDELPFLDFEIKALHKQCDKAVFIISCAPDQLPNNYLERLNILRKISNLDIYFDKLSIKKRIIENEENYLKLLSKVYGYEKFRNVEFYKDITNKSKETIQISQLQIISDIVEQAEHALNGESFRDIYVTASTGAGKSIMFQIPALYLSEKYDNDKPITLVISPLIGLMKDQVDSLKRKDIKNSATINGDTLPFDKARILEKIKNQEIDILYLSPETLQMRGDIRMLIGERKIGIVIIDEAHIVTTWGRSFRSDYWYLGIYLAKLRKVYKFPIVTFTATSIYGGNEDMYLDTRNSLNLISPISYFGKVRRNNIYMNVNSSEKVFDGAGRDYRKTKNILALRHLKKARKNNQKTLMYFPTIKLLEMFYGYIRQNCPEIYDVTGRYHGRLEKEEKDDTIKKFKSGDLQFVLATKAFGMGIDISDITNVYHYAPTGNVVDYIQEIGRAARDKSKVAKGMATIDFLPRDMGETKKLYGMSAIRNSQILEVMRKIKMIYEEKGNERNLVVSPEDFKYIFRNTDDESSLENKVKTVLLMIEKDFSSPTNIGYPPFVARPRQLFGNDLIMVSPIFEEKLKVSRLKNFFKKIYYLESSRYSAIYQVNLSGIWEKYYRDMTFPRFKYAIYNQEERNKLKHKKLFDKFEYACGIEVSLKNGIAEKEILSNYYSILNVFEKFINEYRLTGKQFDTRDLGAFLSRNLKIADKFVATSLGQALINTAFEFGNKKKMRFISEIDSGFDNRKYAIYQDGSIFTEYVISTLRSILKPMNDYVQDETGNVMAFYRRNFGKYSIDSELAVLRIGETANLLGYQLFGGGNPQIYLRMNSVYPLERAIKKGEKYRNSILEDVRNKHKTSWRMLHYMFTKKQPEKKAIDRIMNYTPWFWDTIEDYFMGIIPNEVAKLDGI